VTRPGCAALAAQLKAATGPDTGLDAAIAEAFGVPAADYTESAEACRRLVALVLPGWHLHLGFGALGLFPYAVISQGDERAEAEAPTVPLAILRAVGEVTGRE
jgi:hypothetical protein